MAHSMQQMDLHFWDLGDPRAEALRGGFGFSVTSSSESGNYSRTQRAKRFHADLGAHRTMVQIGSRRSERPASPAPKNESTAGLVCTPRYATLSAGR